jgi:hypothetical protein
MSRQTPDQRGATNPDDLEAGDPPPPPARHSPVASLPQSVRETPAPRPIQIGSPRPPGDYPLYGIVGPHASSAGPRVSQASPPSAPRDTTLQSAAMSPRAHSGPSGGRPQVSTGPGGQGQRRGGATSEALQGPPPLRTEPITHPSDPVMRQATPHPPAAGLTATAPANDVVLADTLHTILQLAQEALKDVNYVPPGRHAQPLSSLTPAPGAHAMGFRGVEMGGRPDLLQPSSLSHHAALPAGLANPNRGVQVCSCSALVLLTCLVCITTGCACACPTLSMPCTFLVDAAAAEWMHCFVYNVSRRLYI